MMKGGGGGGDFGGGGGSTSGGEIPAAVSALPSHFFIHFFLQQKNIYFLNPTPVLGNNLLNNYFN